MSTKPATPASLEYRRVRPTLLRPWYVWTGAVIATFFLGTIGVAAAIAVAKALRPGAYPLDATLFIAMLLLVILVCVMLLIMEWRAIFRYSAVASALVGAALVLPAGLATAGELSALAEVHFRAMGSPAVWFFAPIVISLGFACWTHCRWAGVIANWLTRTAGSQG